MTPVTLTGRAASEALALYTRIGAAEARFDRHRLALAMRTSAGRRRVAAGLVLGLRALAAAIVGVPASLRLEGRETGSRRLRRLSTDDGSPDRPRLAGVG